MFVVKMLEGICNVGKHGEMDFAVVVVPFQIESKVSFFLPIAGDGIVLLEDFHAMVCMLLANIFHTKIFHTKGERYGTPIMFPKTRGEFALLIPLFV